MQVISLEKRDAVQFSGNSKNNKWKYLKIVIAQGVMILKWKREDLDLILGINSLLRG